MAKIQFREGNGAIQWSLKNGKWFEDLVGYVLSDLNADDVNTGTSIAWSEAMETSLLNRHGMLTAMNEIDVVARFGINYYVVSCKATAKEAVNELTTEVMAMASLFGRFTVPMLCFLRYYGKPYNHNGVYIFGCKTLCDKEKMKELLQSSLNEKRTTSGAKYHSKT